MGNTGDGAISPTLNFVHRNNQRIGVAIADNPNGPWSRLQKPIIDVSPDPSAPDSLCTSNPSITQGRDGRYYLLYKGVGRQKPLPFGGPVVHLMAVSKSPTGPFRKELKPLFTIAGNSFPFEDPFLWFDRERDTYFTILKDNHGVTSGPKQSSLVLFESHDALDWHPAEHPFIDNLELHWRDRPVQHVEAMERPQLMFDSFGRPAILTVATKDGSATTYNVRIPLRSPEIHTPSSSQ
jgi:hypothetical protein